MKLCVIVLFMNNVGIEKSMNVMGMPTMSVVGILPTTCVNEYQESGPMSGTHVTTEHFGPNAMVLPTSHDHRQADMTKKTFVHC